MTLIRWNPLRDVAAWHPVTDIANELIQMQREVDRMFDRFQGGIQDNHKVSAWVPALDVIERNEDYRVKVELPGVDKKDVKITIQNNVLTIHGEKKREQDKKEGNYHRVERSFGSFERSFTLPPSVVTDRIEASYDNGVLAITLPKVEEAKPREIEVQVK